MAFLSIAGSLGALLVGWLVVVARRLYCARHLFSLDLSFDLFECLIFPTFHACIILTQLKPNQAFVAAIFSCISSTPSVGTKNFLTPIKIRIFGPKNWLNLVKNMHFWSFWTKYWHFLPILSNARPKTNSNKVPRWVFHYVGNKTFDFTSKN